MTADEIHAVKTNTWTLVSDVTAKLQEALNTGATDIYMPPDIYKTVSQLTLKQGQTLRGNAEITTPHYLPWAQQYYSGQLLLQHASKTP